MGKIRFSHEYHKFPYSLDNMDRVVLLEVLKAKSEDLSEEFIKYDTEVKTPIDTTSDYMSPLKYYKLPQGDILILILQATHEMFSHQSSGIFTTIRQWTAEKERYYKSLRGKEVEIVIEKVEV